MNQNTETAKEDAGNARGLSRKERLEKIAALATQMSERECDMGWDDIADLIKILELAED